LDQRQHLCERHFFVIVVNAQFGVAQIASNVDVRYSRASLDQLLELLRSAEFVGLAGDDEAQFELTCMAAGFGRTRTGRSRRPGRMMVVVVVAVIVIVLMIMSMMVMVMIVIVIVVVMTVPMIMLMLIVVMMIMLMMMIMSMLATRPMNMFVVFRFRHGNL
jgi:hypothetical protein